MSLRNFCSGLYRFFTWPFRKIYGFFTVSEGGVPSLTKSVTSHRTPEAKLSPKIYIRKKMQNEKQQEMQGKIHFKPLFLPDHFSALSDSKNDAEFKNNREQQRKRQDRIKARKAMLKVLAHMEEMDRIDKEIFENQQKLKKKKDIKPTTPTPEKT